MRAAIAREFLRLGIGSEHAATVAFVVERLVADEQTPSARRSRSGRRWAALVIVTVQSDATMVLVRDAAPESTELPERRRQLLEAYTTRWSTMSGGDGRTIWAEITHEPEPAAPTGAPVDADLERPAPARAGALPCAP